MSKIEALQKRIDKIADKVKFLRYILFALISSNIGLIFGISQGRIIENLMSNTVLIAGTFVLVTIGIIISKEEKQRDLLIDKLEITKKDD